MGDREKTAMKNDNFINDLLNYMHLPRWSASARRKLVPFDGAVPFFGPFFEFYNELGATHGIWTNTEPDATGKLMDLMLLKSLDMVKPAGQKLPPFVPSRLRFKSPTKFEFSVAYPNAKTRTVFVNRYAGRLVDGAARLDRMNGHTLSRWLDDRKDTAATREAWRLAEKAVRRAVTLEPGLYFNLYHMWSVYFRVPGSLSVRFPVDARTALAVFRDRAKTPGKIRRDALLHWVQAHLRRKQNSETDLVSVRKHVRGREEFFWHGFECVIQPDEDYVKKLP